MALVANMYDILKQKQPGAIKKGAAKQVGSIKQYN